VKGALKKFEIISVFIKNVHHSNSELRGRSVDDIFPIARRSSLFRSL